MASNMDRTQYLRNVTVTLYQLNYGLAVLNHKRLNVDES
jgi:hypothetical protein